MNKNGIKPIPKYILKKIQKLDMENCKTPSGKTRFYSYLTKLNKRLCQVIVAVRHKHKNWYCKQVVIHTVHSNVCYIKDIVFYYVTGYVVGWCEEGLQKERKWFEDGSWEAVSDKYFNIRAKCVNPEFATKIEKYKYSGVENLYGDEIMKYLRIYEEYPIAEMLIKLGLKRFVFYKTILRECKKKSFRKWLVKHRYEFILYYDVAVIIRAFRENLDLQTTQRLENKKKDLVYNSCYSEFKHILGKEKLRITAEYLENHNIGVYSYYDYLEACDFLNLDMTQDKNLFPHDFKRWHDIRIDEYHTKQAEIDAKLKKELLANFARIAEKYLPLQRKMKEDFVCLIAKSPSELVNEGEKLCHCVGIMNYDQKFAREESSIFFVRASEQPEVPLVTLEFDPKKKKILQCYGEHDSRPPQEILDFVNNVWLPYAKRKTQKIESAT